MRDENTKVRDAMIPVGNGHKCGAPRAGHTRFRLKPLAQAISWTLMMGASGAYAATITVDTNVDEVVGTTLGTCTLREAVQAANTNAIVSGCDPGGSSGNDDIVFTTGLSTITLNQGWIVVTPSTEHLTITGPVAGQTVSGNNASGIFDSEANLSLTNMILTNGSISGSGGDNGRGGGIRVSTSGGSASLTLTDSTVQNSSSSRGGGGIWFRSGGTLTLANSTISGNSTGAGQGCGVAVYQGTVDIDDSIISSNNCNVQGGGVAIRNNSTTTTIDNTTFSDNGHLLRYGGGISTRGTVTITDSTFTGNIASHGGGIGVESGTTNVINTTFSNNQASSGGGLRSKGTAVITNSTFTGNQASSSGGGINVSSGNVTLTNSVVTGNTAVSGGGILAGGPLTLDNSVVSNNAASEKGGGIAGASWYTYLIDINDSTISNNTAVKGGGIFAHAHPVKLVNSTVSGNEATAGSGGGIYSSKYLKMYNTTISGNTGTGTGGGVYSITFQVPPQFGGQYFDGKFTSVSTIISGNTATTANDVSSTNGLYADYSLLGAGVSGIDGANNPTQTDSPGLQALTDNGCAVQAGVSTATECVKTRKLNTTSPAIDNGSNPESLSYDERGNVARSIDGNLDPADSPDYAQTDIGAYELQLQDFGDAPSTYGEAKHFASANLMLSASFTLGDIDHDDANQANAGATGDDGDGGDDEAAVVFSSPALDNYAEVIATVSVTNDTGAVATVCGWLNPWDSNGDPVDGTFTGDTPKCTIVADNNGTATEVVLTWDDSELLPRADGSTFARFRVCSTASQCNVPTGTADTGEVEDYKIDFKFDPTQVTMGEVGVAAETTDDFFSQLGHETSVLLELLRHWDPQSAAALPADVDAATLRALLLNYLDPDGDGRVPVFHWQTLEERGTIGFYVERTAGDDGQWQRLNRGEMMPGLITAPMGGEYRLAVPDLDMDSTYQFRLIELEARGTTRTYGPFGFKR